MTDDSSTFRRTVSSDDLARLKQEREEVDRKYNEALTALDRAVQQMPSLPDPPPPPDDSQVGPLNARWRLIPDHAPTVGSGLRAWFRRVVWKLVAPAFQQQHEFNSALVDHFNRNLRVDRERNQVLFEVLATLRGQSEALTAFENRLVLFVQQLTPYVDTKDLELAGILRRINEDRAEAIVGLEQRTVGLAGGIGGVSDELQKRWESMVARERRYEAQVHEVRTTLSTLQQSSLTLKRELERWLERRPDAPPPQQPSDAAAHANASTTIDSYKYVGFEDQFRGSPKQIRSRLEAYLPDFEGASDVLDVGCGRGEFLDLLREHDIGGRGLDLNHEMVEVCHSRGLTAAEGDALGYLEGLPDKSLGGLMAAQVVEHLDPGYLMQMLDAAYHKLRPGSKIILETINPACWYAFFESYIRDVTHVRPLHPDTLQYLMLSSGFQKVDVRYSAPFPDDSKLQSVPTLAVATGGERTSDIEAVISTVNENASKLNTLLFTHLDYAAVGERL
mgnify:FL=1